MFKFNFKSNKVFEKLNKLNRKQAYTIGAIVVVVVVALLMLVTAMSSEDDSSFAGMHSRGYDLAQMPFATDAAEQYLLANAYPDMKENGSTLLYSAEEKQERQEEDAQSAQNEEANEDEEYSGSSGDEAGSYAGSSRGYGGYGGGRGSSGRGPTEIGQLGSAGMATASGSGVSSTYGPTGDFRQFKGRENRGSEAPVQLKTTDGRRALAQFRQGTLAAARTNENKMSGAGKALMGGTVAGSEAFTKDGVDLSKLQEGGLTLDTSAPATTTDLDNLDKKVAEAAKKAEEKKKEEDKRSWWEDLLIDLAKRMAGALADSVMGAVGDTIRGGINSSVAANKAKNGVYRDDSDKQYANLTDDDVKIMTNGKYKTAADYKKKNSQKDYYHQYGKDNAKNNEVVVGQANEEAKKAREEAYGRSMDAQERDAENRRIEEERKAAEARQREAESRQKAAQEEQRNQQRNSCQQEGKVWNEQTNSCEYRSV